MVSNPYQVTEDQVERSSTLDESDVGRWAFDVNGAVHFAANEKAARETVEALRNNREVA